MDERRRCCHSYGHNQWLAWAVYRVMKPYPSDPCTAFFAKDHLPCWFEGLKILVRLEEGLDGQTVEESEADKEDKYLVLRSGAHGSPEERRVVGRTDIAVGRLHFGRSMLDIFDSGIFRHGCSRH